LEVETPVDDRLQSTPRRLTSPARPRLADDEDELPKRRKREAAVPARSSLPLVPLIVGAVGVLLLVGGVAVGVAAWLFLRSSSPTPATPVATVAGPGQQANPVQQPAPGQPALPNQQPVLGLQPIP